MPFNNNNNYYYYYNNKHIYKAPCMPTEGSRGAEKAVGLLIMLLLVYRL